jgi:hypothetical protein
MDNRITTKSLVQKREEAARALEKKALAMVEIYNRIPSFAGKQRLGDLIADVRNDSGALAENLKLDVAYWPDGVQ